MPDKFPNWRTTQHFFAKFLWVEITEDRIKACHMILNSGNKYQLPTENRKYIYFADKQSAHKKRKWLKNKKQDKY